MTPYLRRIIVTLLCIYTFSLNIFSICASQPEDVASDPHYVIVTDLTEEKDSAQLRRSLAELITDLLPLENARISLICYGYKDPNGDAFPFFRSDNAIDAEYIHKITPPDGLSEADAKEYRNALVQTLCGLSAKNNRKSPHGHALLASMRHLESTGTQDGMGRVILISDGNRASSDHEIDTYCKEEALKISQAHHWPVFTIELDQDNRHIPLPDDLDYNALDSSEATREQFPRIFMTEVAWKSGARQADPNASDSLRPCAWVIGGDPDNGVSPETHHMTQVRQAVLEILGYQTEEMTFDDIGIMDFPFTVTNLTCEKLFYLPTTAPDHISVFPVSDDNTPLTDQPVGKNILQITGRNFHSTIRLLCPPPGNYVLRVQGQPNAKFPLSTQTVIAPELKITFLDKAQNPLTLDKNENLLLPYGDPLTVIAECWYGETLLVLSPDDQTFTAQVTLELDKQNNTPTHLETLMNAELIPTETNWFFPISSPSDYNISPDNNSHSYQIRFSLTPTDTDTAPLLTKQYSLVTNLPDPVNEFPNIELGNIPVNGQHKFQLPELPDDMPAGPMKFSLVGQDNAGNAFHLLSPVDEQPYTELSGEYGSLTLLTNNCVGEYYITLTVSSFHTKQPFTLHFYVTKPEEPEELEETEASEELEETEASEEPEETEKTEELDIDDYDDIVLYDRSPSSLFRWFIRDYDVSYPCSWGQGITLTELPEYDHRIIRFSVESYGSITITALSVGETDITVTLTNGICEMDENHIIHYFTDDCTLHVTVKSMAMREINCIVFFLLCLLLVFVVLFILQSRYSKAYCLVTYLEDHKTKDSAALKVKKNNTIRSYASNLSWPQECGFLKNEELTKLLEFIDNTHLAPILFPCFPILVTKIPDPGKVQLGNEKCKHKFALVTKKRPLKFTAGKAKVTIEKTSQQQ